MQAGFAAALLDPERAVPAGLTRRQGGAPERRFAVYRNNVMASLMQALEEQFPATLRLVGEAGFRYLARTFVRRHPPASPLLALYGAGIADFLAAAPELEDYPVIADVARIEYAWSEAYHAEDAPALAPEALAALGPEDLPGLRLRWHPAARLVRSRFPAVTVFADNRRAEEPPPRALATAEDALLTRPALAVQVTVLPPGGHDFLAAIRDGRCLVEAAAAGAAAAQDFDLAANLAGMLAAGAVTAPLARPGHGRPAI
jgi:hypothetical protein